MSSGGGLRVVPEWALTHWHRCVAVVDDPLASYDADVVIVTHGGHVALADAGSAVAFVTSVGIPTIVGFDESYAGFPHWL
jgi:hypothetical protein